MDYKNLIEQLKRAAPFHGTWLRDRMLDAATAIETLLAERDALESDLLAFRTCGTCANAEENSGRGRPCPVGSVCTGQYWQWRGSQEEATP